MPLELHLIPRGDTARSLNHLRADAPLTAVGEEQARKLGELAIQRWETEGGEIPPEKSPPHKITL